MQAIAPVTPAQLRQKGQQPLMKFEVFVAPAWHDLAALAGKHYVESISVSLGGATMTPNPVAGTWNAMLANEGSIFHSDHPTSAYKTYCVAGRQVKISIGAKYGGVNRYWQRLIGYMGEPGFSAPDFKVDIRGADYMKFLADAQFQELDATYPNHWGASQLYDSWPSDGMVGGELYVEGDAMDIAADANNIGGWVANNCNFVSFDAGVGDPAQPSNFVGRLTASVGATSYVQDLDVADVVINHTYKVTFWHRAVGEAADTEKILVRIYQGGNPIKTNTYYSSDTWTESTLFFTATATAVVGMRINCPPTIADLRVDLFSIQRYVAYEDRYYQLPGASKGPYHVILDGAKVEQGEEDEGWYHEEATKRVFFDANKTVADGAGTNNVEIFYYTLTPLEDAVARILWFAGLYANEVAAKAAIVAVPEYVDPAVDIDKVWFEAGSTLLGAIRMICERCDYRFYFRYDGAPVFRPKPTAGAAVFTFTSAAHIVSVHSYQDQNEIKNRVIIKGMKQAEPINLDETVPSELVGEASDAASIAAYGDRTLTIKNHLFQTQGPLNAMCITLRDEYKIPKWYCDLEMIFLPAPLELGDNIQWEERLAHGLDVTQTGIIRDMKISNFSATYTVEKT